MTDRELLELAAKAAGLELGTWNETHRSIYYPFHASTLTDGHYWNPIDEDSDALRLAVKFAMYVALDNAAREVIACAAEGNVVKEWCGDDPYAATRRAIVRAAAEIGRQMGGGNAE